ncbi:probable serine/threonine-protein kinase kinX isoform X2 [Zingiber officinale]|uniref:probable serine/threonine-protein kinase kinX isoform X2 n=1 Tax=Zingiber officinale TaxID=94328 RepID=UPI001C4BB360|nr:probable serine/threonine-protein kinase kinX isoform X2 [Zingiber officinale]
MEPFSKRKRRPIRQPSWDLAGEDHGGDTNGSIDRGGVKDPEVIAIFDTDEEEEVEGQGKGRQVSVPLSQKVSDGDLEVEEVSERDAQPMDDSKFQLNDTCTTDVSSSSVEVMDEDNFETIIMTDVEEDDEEDKEHKEWNEDDEKISKTCHPVAYSCPASRTRSSIGNQPRVSYCRYFETLDSNEDDDEEEEGLLKDVSSSSSKKKMISKTNIPWEDQPLPPLNQKNKFSEEEGSEQDEPLSSSKKKMLSKTDHPLDDEEPLSSLNKKNKISIPPNDEPSSSLNKKKFSEPQKDEPSSSSNSAKSGKRKRDIKPTNCSISKLLVNMICNKTKDIPPESPKNELCNEEPDIFSWDTEPKVADKSDHEKFIDELWADFDFFMCSMNISFYNADKAPENTLDQNPS